jgi:LmbE family N-acetylglucosaminyl deacetylase
VGEAVEHRAQPADTHPVVSARPSVLLVEDDEVLAAVVRELLSTHAQVDWVTSAEEALDRALRGRYDLVLADIELPGLSGLDLVGRLTEAQPHVATLIVSGRTSFDDAVAAIRAGADDYLAKPIDPAALLAKAEELIARTRARRAAARQSVLAVGAHPDDVEIGVGGILLRHAAADHDVAVLTLTGGERGGTVAERAEESKRAAALLGARLFHHGLADTSVGDGGETIAAIKAVIDEVRPTTVYTHTSRDVHQDHRSVHHATLVAARGIPRVYCYQAPSSTVEFCPTRFVTVDPFIEAKLDAIRAYGSQTAIRSYLDEELLRATARYWARFSRTRYVEPLEVVRESDAESVAPPAPQLEGVADAR